MAMSFRWLIAIACLALSSLGLAQDYFVKKVSFITGSTSAYFDAVTADDGGGCYVAGRRNNGGTRTTVLQKYDSNGVVVWTSNLTFLPAEGKCVQILLSGGQPIFFVGYTHPQFGPQVYVTRLSPSTGALVWEKFSNMTPKAAATSSSGTASRIVLVGSYPHVSNPSFTRYTIIDFKLSNGATTKASSDPTFDNTTFEDIVYSGNQFKIACLRNGRLQMAVRANTDGASEGFAEWATLPGTYFGPQVVALSGGDVGFAARRVNNGIGTGYFLRVQGLYTTVYETSGGSPNANLVDLKALSSNRMIAVGKTGGTVSVGQVYRIQSDGVVNIQEYARTAGTILPKGIWVDEIETVHVAHSVQTMFTERTWGMGSVANGGWKHSFLWNFQDSEPYAMDTAAATGKMFIVGRRDYAGINVGFLATVIAIPDTIADTYEMRTGTTWVENGYGAQLNDFGIVGATTTYTDQATNGTFSPALAGGFTYAPDPGFVGSDGVKYKLSRDGQESPPTIIALIVQPEIIAIDAPVVHSGTSSTLTIRLNGPRQLNTGTIYLADNSAQTAMPATVSVPVNTSSRTFALTTTQDLVDRTTTIFAQIIFPNSTQTFTKTLTIKGLALTSLSLNPASLVGGRPFVGTVSLSAPTTAARTVNITHSGSDVATPISASVAVGQSTATFDGGTSVSSTSVTRTVTATFNGVSIARDLTLNPGGLFAFTITPTSVRGGVGSQGKLQTAGLAPSGGTTAFLSVNGASVTVPASATVAAGAQFGTFLITTSAVSSTVTRTVTAQWATITKTATLTVTP